MRPLATRLLLTLLLLFSSHLLAETASATLDEPTREQLEEELSRWADKEEPLAKGIAENYREALAALQRSLENNARTELFRQRIDSSKRWAETLSELQQRLHQANLPLPEITQTPADELAKQLDRQQVDQGVLRNRVQELEDTLSKLRLRPDRSAQELTEAKQQLDQIETALRTPEDPNDSLAKSRQAMLSAQKQERTSRVALLELERLSHPQRQEEAEQRLTTAQAERKRAELLTQQLQEQLNELHSARAEQALREVEQQLRSETSHPLLQQALERNGDYGRSLKQLAEAVDQVTREKETTLTLTAKARAGRERINRQMEILGLDESLGELLRLEKRRMPKIGQLQKRFHQVQKTTAEIRIEAFRLDPSETLTQEADPPEFTGMTSDQAQQLRARLSETDQKAAELRQQLAAEYGRYEKSLVDLRLAYAQLIDVVQQYEGFLDRNMVWVRGGSLFSAELLASMGTPLTWLLQQDRWDGSLEDVMNALASSPLAGLFTLLLAIAALISRPKMHHAFGHWAPKIGKVRDDRFHYSLSALGLMLLVSLGPLAPLPYLGWAMRTLGETQVVIALGAGILDAALLWVLLLGCRELLRPEGLARVHFRWDNRTCALLYQHLGWLTPLLVPFALLIGLLEWIPGDVDRNALARILFILSNLLLALFLRRIFHPQDGIFGCEETNGPSCKAHHRTINFLLPLIPLSMALLALIGYYYGALKLESLLVQSGFLLVAVLILNAMARRKLMIAQRRLALRRARERRAAMLESRAKERESTGDEVLEGLPVEEMEQIDLETIDGQTRTMLRVIITLISVLLLSWLWAEIIPALGGLDEITLWEYAAGSDPADRREVSLWDLLLGLSVLALTFIAANNLPGVLEITLLQPLEVETGNRYAISLISRYFIVAFGLVTAFILIGLSWNDVQWLVAAMGVGLGFGLKEIFANFFSGLILLFERPIRIGDWVTIGEQSGAVSRIRIRATTVTDWDNRELIIPNKNFLTETLNNWSLSDTITRVTIKVGVAYGSDTEKVVALLRQITNEHPDVMQDPSPSVLFLAFGDSTLNFEVRAYVEDRLHRLQLIHDLHMRIDKVFRQEGVEIAFPQRDLHLRSIDPQARLQIDWGDKPPAPSA